MKKSASTVYEDTRMTFCAQDLTTRFAESFYQVKNNGATEFSKNKVIPEIIEEKNHSFSDNSSSLLSDDSNEQHAHFDGVLESLGGAARLASASSHVLNRDESMRFGSIIPDRSQKSKTLITKRELILPERGLIIFEEDEGEHKEEQDDMFGELRDREGAQ